MKKITSQHASSQKATGIAVNTDQFQALSKQMEGLATQVDTLTIQVGSLATQVDTVTKQVSALATRVDSLTTQVEGIALFLQQFSTATEKRFDRLETEVAIIKEEVGSLRVRVTTIESEMVTKEYLDYKFMEIRDDFTSKGRREDQKVNTLIHLLCDKRVITKQEMKRIAALEPYAE